MTDVAHANALAKQERLTHEIKELQQRLDGLRRESKRIDEWLASWAEFAGVDQPSEPVVGLGNATVSEVPAKAGRSANPKKEWVADFARQLANDRGMPVSRNAIKVALEQEGVFLQGSDPDMVLSTMLWRMKDHIVRLKGFGYWPREMDYAPAQYQGGTVPEDEAGKRRYEQMYDHPTSIAGLEATIAREDGEV